MGLRRLGLTGYCTGGADTLGPYPYTYTRAQKITGQSTVTTVVNTV